MKRSSRSLPFWRQSFEGAVELALVLGHHRQQIGVLVGPRRLLEAGATNREVDPGARAELRLVTVASESRQERFGGGEILLAREG